MPFNLKSKLSVPPSAVHAIGAAITLIAAVTFYRGLYAPMRREIADLKFHIDKLSGLTARGDAISAEHRRMVKRLGQLTTAAQRTRRRMPVEHSGGEFVEQATRLAGELGLEVEQCQTGPPQLHADHATIEVSCRLTGSFASICNYLAAIDQVPQISRVWRLELNRSPDPQAYPVQVTFQLYYQLDPHDKDQQGGIL